MVGWGLDERGIATEELTLVEMPVVRQLTCLRSYSEFFDRYTSDLTYCAGYRNGTYMSDRKGFWAGNLCSDSCTVVSEVIPKLFLVGVDIGV